MRATVAALLLLAASALPLTARADTVDVFTLTGNGHTEVLTFPAIVAFAYPSVPIFVPGIAPLSETIDGVNVPITNIQTVYFHDGNQTIMGDFGTLFPASLLEVLSSSGPFTYPNSFQTYYDYTATFHSGTFGVYSLSEGSSYPTYSLSVQQESTTATPEPSSLLLLATGLPAAMLLERRRRTRSEFE
jgi:hypothetical protein